MQLGKRQTNLCLNVFVILGAFQNYVLVALKTWVKTMGKLSWGRLKGGRSRINRGGCFIIGAYLRNHTEKQLRDFEKWSLNWRQPHSWPLNRGFGTVTVKTKGVKII